ncbi:sensor histidine kinase [Aquibacillus kalidii]|uniref:sensor histidine kinase n=1 Tax=Aquibacillus kalidii TaxID=2762597 RepID=UPI0016457A4A|nr:ATP-binding protein [Aquibacillus kalidii]
MKLLKQHMSFRNRILTILLTITFIFSVFSIILVYTISNVTNITNDIKERNIPSLVWLSYWERELELKENMVYDSLANDLSQDFISAYRIKTNDDVTVLKQDIPESLEHLEREVKLLDFLIVNDVQGLLQYGDVDAAEKVLTENYLPKLNDLQNQIKNAGNIEYAEFNDNTETYPSIIKTSIWLLISLMLGSIVISLFASYRISKSLTKPIDSMIEKVNKIANGNYGLTVSSTEQVELQSLASSINQMSFSLKHSFQTILLDKLKREQIFDSLPVGIITYDNQTREFSGNSFVYELFSIPTIENHLSAQLEFINNDSLKPFWDILYSGLSCFNKKIRYEKNGNTNYLLVSQTDLVGSENEVTGRIFYFIDITETETLEKRMYLSEKLALIGEMAASSAHEIRNPLTVIHGFISLMNSTMREEDKEKFHVNLLLKEIDRLNSIVGEMLLMAKPNQPKKESISLKEIMDDILPLIKNSSLSDQIEFKLDLSPAIIQVDSKQMKQVLLNLIRNSREALEGKGEILVRSKVINNMYYIYLEDDGPGIPAEIKSSLFEPFSSSKESGTGLGLNIVKRIIENHDGTIELVDTSEKGTKFLIKLNMKNG